MADPDHLFLRGVKAVSTESSRLVSSSKYLNNGRLREWVAMISLRRNGSDFPAPAELVELVEILDSIRDYDYIEHLFTKERASNPRLDAWLGEAYMSPPSTVQDFARYPAGSPGGILHAQFVGRFQTQIIRDQWEPPRSQFDFYHRREVQNHDLEHILLGASVDALGELPPSWFRMTNVPRFINDQELVGELLAYKIFASLRFTTRTMLHYPHVWSHCADAIHRGMTAGWASGPLFMQKLEPILGLLLQDARAALGLKSVVDRDTTAASLFWTEEGPAPPPLTPAEILGSPPMLTVAAE